MEIIYDQILFTYFLPASKINQITFEVSTKKITNIFPCLNAWKFPIFSFEPPKSNVPHLRNFGRYSGTEAWFWLRSLNFFLYISRGFFFVSRTNRPSYRRLPSNRCESKIYHEECIIGGSFMPDHVPHSWVHKGLSADKIRTLKGMEKVYLFRLEFPNFHGLFSPSRVGLVFGRCAS